jgi:hypothetical protein
MDPSAAPLDQREFVTAALVGAYPPRWHHPNKQLVYEIACTPAAGHVGRINFSRWPALPLPTELSPLRADLVVSRPGFFDYAPLLDPAGALEWHLNFADPHLFAAYGGPLFAQDEMQVAEHPALGSLREALLAAGAAAVTIEHGRPTPVLVSGVQRRVAIATDQNPAAGRPAGLYGNAFARADPAAIRAAVRRINPPTFSNIIAIAAPVGGRGQYRPAEIELSLLAAYSGFRAAVLESERQRGTGIAVVVHTGYWGCGAFGGSRVLMTLLQLAAAQLAGLERIVMHTGGPGGDAPVQQALATLHELFAGGPRETSTFVSALAQRGFTWGVSDGN